MAKRVSDRQRIAVWRQQDTFISSMQVFQSVDVLTDSVPLKATKVIFYWIYTMAFHDFRAGRSSALVIIFFLIIMALKILQFLLSKKKVHYEE